MYAGSDDETAASFGSTKMVEVPESVSATKAVTNRVLWAFPDIFGAELLVCVNGNARPVQVLLERGSVAPLDAR